MAKKTVDIYPSDNASEEGIFVGEVDRISFIDAESHGPGRVFGIDDQSKGKRTVIICSPNVAAVVVDQ